MSCPRTRTHVHARLRHDQGSPVQCAHTHACCRNDESVVTLPVALNNVSHTQPPVCRQEFVVMVPCSYTDTGVAEGVETGVVVIVVRVNLSTSVWQKQRSRGRDSARTHICFSNTKSVVNLSAARVLQKPAPNLSDLCMCPLCVCQKQVIRGRGSGCLVF